MAEEEKTGIEEGTGGDFSAEDYIKKLDEIRSGMVPKDKYDKLAGENKQLVEALAKGNYEQPDMDTPADPSEIGKKLFAKSPKYHNDLEYFTDVLAYRDAVIESGSQDPFLPYSHDYVPSESETRRAQEIADILKECVEYADGDPSIFTSELKRRGVNIETRRR